MVVKTKVTTTIAMTKMLKELVSNPTPQPWSCQATGELIKSAYLTHNSIYHIKKEKL